MMTTRGLSLRVAHASRVLVSASRRNELSLTCQISSFDTSGEVRECGTVRAGLALSPRLRMTTA